jgi:gas vesicle protein
MQKRSKFFIGAVVGSTIGAITTLLFNTSEGKKIQKKLMKKFHDMHGKEKLAHTFEMMKKKMTNPLKTAKRKAKSLKRKAKKKVA